MHTQQKHLLYRITVGTDGKSHLVGCLRAENEHSRYFAYSDFGGLRFFPELFAIKHAENAYAHTTGAWPVHNDSGHLLDGSC